MKSTKTIIFTFYKKGIYMLILIFNISVVASAQNNIIYIDPGYYDVKEGTILKPFNSWDDIQWKEGYTYLFKRGSTLQVNFKMRPNANNITIGAYGLGARPIIKSSVPNSEKVLDLGSLKNVIIKDLEIESTNNAQSCLHFFNSTGGTIINCKIHGGEWGVRNVASTGLFRIINCEIYITGDDGCFTKELDSIEVTGTYIHDVNQKYFINTSESFSGGDCLQLESVKYFNIHDNLIDHSRTGNKFCIISNSDKLDFIATGLIERNHLLRDNLGNLIYLDHTKNVLIINNCFENAEIAIYNRSENPNIYFNEFINIKELVFELLGPVGSNATIINNTFFNIRNLLSLTHETVSFINNIVFNCYGNFQSGEAKLNQDYNCFFNASEVKKNIGEHSFQADALFVDTAKNDFRLRNHSPCIGKGLDNLDIFKIINGENNFEGQPIDIGAHQSRDAKDDLLIKVRNSKSFAP
jgi:hypothetical protein